jgi:hypothetical protein
MERCVRAFTLSCLSLTDPRYLQLEYWLSLLKIISIVIFFFLGIAVNAGGNTAGEYSAFSLSSSLRLSLRSLTLTFSPSRRSELDYRRRSLRRWLRRVCLAVRQCGFRVWRNRSVDVSQPVFSCRANPSHLQNRSESRPLPSPCFLTPTMERTDALPLRFLSAGEQKNPLRNVPRTIYRVCVFFFFPLLCSQADQRSPAQLLAHHSLLPSDW